MISPPWDLFYPSTTWTLIFSLHRRRTFQLEEGDVGILHPVFSQTCQSWMAFMNRLGMFLVSCPDHFSFPWFQLSLVWADSAFLSVLIQYFKSVSPYKEKNSPIGTKYKSLILFLESNSLVGEKIACCHVNDKNLTPRIRLNNKWNLLPATKHLSFLKNVLGKLCSDICWFLLCTGCPSVQQCVLESVSRFLLPSIMLQVVNLVTTLASDTTVKVFEKVR